MSGFWRKQACSITFIHSLLCFIDTDALISMQLRFFWSIKPTDWIQLRHVVLLIMNQSMLKMPTRQEWGSIVRPMLRACFETDMIVAVCGCLIAFPLSSDIDECADGFVECDSKSTCVNLPGWYHCECRDGYHDNGLFSTNGESCVGEWPAFSVVFFFFFFCKKIKNIETEFFTSQRKCVIYLPVP